MMSGSECSKLRKKAIEEKKPAQISDVAQNKPSDDDLLTQ